jgi:hypothetical protein
MVRFVNPSMRLRQWAARLTLLVACVATVATSKSASPPVTAEYQGETLRLTTEARTLTRHILVRASARRSSKVVGGSASVELTPRWLPTRADATVRPSLRVRVRHQSDPNPPEGWTHTVDAPPGGQGSPIVEGQSLGGGCELDENCRWNLLLDVELLGDIGDDVVELDWKVMASAEAYDTEESPDGFAVHISEP